MNVAEMAEETVRKWSNLIHGRMVGKMVLKHLLCDAIQNAIRAEREECAKVADDIDPSIANQIRIRE